MKLYDVAGPNRDFTYKLITNPIATFRNRKLKSSVQGKIVICLSIWLAESLFWLIDACFFPDLEKVYTVVFSKAYTAINRNRTGNHKDSVKCNQHSHSFYSPNTH